MSPAFSSSWGVFPPSLVVREEMREMHSLLISFHTAGWPVRGKGEEGGRGEEGEGRGRGRGERKEGEGKRERGEEGGRGEGEDS